MVLKEEWSLTGGSFAQNSEENNLRQCGLKKGVVSHQGGLLPALDNNLAFLFPDDTLLLGGHAQHFVHEAKLFSISEQHMQPTIM